MLEAFPSLSISHVLPVQKLHDLEVEKWHRVLDSTMEVMALMQESLKVLHQSVGGQRRRRQQASAFGENVETNAPAGGDVENPVDAAAKEELQELASPKLAGSNPEL